MFMPISPIISAIFLKRPYFRERNIEHPYLRAIFKLMPHEVFRSYSQRVNIQYLTNPKGQYSILHKFWQVLLDFCQLCYKFCRATCKPNQKKEYILEMHLPNIIWNLYELLLLKGYLLSDHSNFATLFHADVEYRLNKLGNLHIWVISILSV